MESENLRCKETDRGGFAGPVLLHYIAQSAGAIRPEQLSDRLRLGIKIQRTYYNAESESDGE